MAEQGQTQSIQARIAALNVGHLGRAPITANASNGGVSERPQLDQRSQSTNLPPALGHNSVSSNRIGNEPQVSRRDGVLPPPTNIVRTGQAVPQLGKPVVAPRLPARKQSTQPSPALPPRRPSEQLSRKASIESVSSTISTVSSISALSNGTARTPGSRTPSMDAGRVKAPVFDPTTLPPLPPKRTKEDIDKRYQDIEKSKAFPGYKDVEKSRMSLQKTKSTPSVATVEITPPTISPSLPPRRPARQESGGNSRKVTPEQPPPMPARSALRHSMNKVENLSTSNGVNGRDLSPGPPPKPARSALSYGMNRVQDPGTTNGSNGRDTFKSGAPPPIPLASRPDISKLQTTKPKPQPRAAPSASACLLCRDFSAVDAHAAKFPRENVPSLDWLATQLTAPFLSSTDQARAIFTWLHHNISYDVVSFFNNNVQPSTPASTLSTGLAVCEGYAGLFTAIASKAGLESVVVGGHGKGFGFASFQPGSPIPPESQGHAWNAVKIDNGCWKLIDPCWGAGNVAGIGQPYNKQFSPQMFTMSNDEFGLRHFPANKNQFFRSDGGRVSWEEYIVGDSGGELLGVCSGVAQSEGISETTLLPKYLKLPVSPSAHQGPTVRFQFSRVCEHWDPVRNGPGKPYVFILAIHGVDGMEDDFVPFETNGMFWWADVVPQKLGARGQTVNLFTVETVGGMSGRGLSVEEYRIAKGRKGMGFKGLAGWQLV